MEAEGGAATSISACRLIDRRDEKDLGQVICVGLLLWVCYHHFIDRTVNLKKSEYFTRSDLPESLGRTFYLASQTTSARVPEAVADQVILCGIYPKTTWVGTWRKSRAENLCGSWLKLLQTHSWRQAHGLLRIIQLDRRSQGVDQKVVGEPRCQAILVSAENERGFPAITAKEA